MASELKGKAAGGLGRAGRSGRVEELRHLEASERGLAAALSDYARTVEGGAGLLTLAARSRRHALQLAERIIKLGGKPDSDSDDLWIVGLVDRHQTMVFAVESALRTYHDHLLDFDAETMALVRAQILPNHRDTLERLTGQTDWVLDALEYG